MTKIKDRVAKLPWPNKENCFLFLSGKIRQKRHFGDKFYSQQHKESIYKYDSETTTEPAITFAYVGENVACEWDGHLGPLQLWFRCDEKHQTDYEKGKEHWIYDYAYGQGHWSQLAVNDNNLYEAFNSGDFYHIFSVLKRFVDEREQEIIEKRHQCEHEWDSGKLLLSNPAKVQCKKCNEMKTI